VEKQKQIRIFDKQAVKYDKRREDQSQKRWRKNLLSHARGEVLELAVGAGANFSYYPPDVKVTATDFSEAMLEKARHAAKSYGLQADFISGDIEAMDFPEASFDTIISTLSFCSYENPLKVLEKVNTWCKPDGNILLMEHGISSKVAVSMLQKTLNPLLYRFSGCHHTRNILKMVRESEMTIEKSESFWFNMAHLIWAKPKF
jgi:ubiquinone/menaquinone biosynthesis C-methylase UbiE